MSPEQEEIVVLTKIFDKQKVNNHKLFKFINTTAKNQK